MKRKPKTAKPAKPIRPFEVAPIDIGPRVDETITDAMICRALEDTNGKITLAARALNMSAIRLRERILATPMLADSLQIAKETTVDIAEFQLEQLAAQGNATAIGIKLKAQAKDRGYGDEVTVNVRGTSPRDALRHVMTQLSDDALAELEQALSSAEGV